MLDENEICEEVQAMLDRIEMFPEEFSKEVSEKGKWSHIINGIDDPNSTNAFTELERTMIRSKVRNLSRVWMKRAILKEITTPELEDDSKDDLKRLVELTYKATQGRSKPRMGFPPPQTPTKDQQELEQFKDLIRAKRK